MMILKILDENSSDNDLQTFCKTTHTTETCQAEVTVDILRRKMNTAPVVLYLIDDKDYKISIGFRYFPKKDEWMIRWLGVSGTIDPKVACRIITDHYEKFMDDNDLKEISGLTLKKYDNERFQVILDNFGESWTMDEDGVRIRNHIFERQNTDAIGYIRSIFKQT